MLFLLDIQNLALLTDLFLHSSHTSLQLQVFVLHLQTPGLTCLARDDVAQLWSGCSKPWVHPMFSPAACSCSSPGANAGFRNRNLLAWAGANIFFRKNCPKLAERIPVPSFMLLTLKSIKIECFQGRKIPSIRLPMPRKLVSLRARHVREEILPLTNTPVSVLKQFRSLTCSV